MSRSQDRKDVLLEAGLTLASELSLPIVLQRIVDVAAQVTDARYGALGVLGETGELVDFITTGISSRQRQAIGALPRGRGILGLLITDPHPIRISNIADHPKSVGFPTNHPPMQSFLGAPVKAMGRVYGNIYLAEKRGAATFSREDEESLVILAAQAGVAIANATLYAEIRRLGLLEERERIAKELHDGVIQSLFAVGMGLQGTALLVGSPEHAARIEDAVTELDKVIRDLRNYIFGLRPGILADRQLDQALRTLVEEFGGRSATRLAVEVDSDLAAKLSSRSHEIVQLTREALSNVVRHAAAKNAAVRLVRVGPGALLSIEDDGSGFDARLDSNGNGLRNMRERASSLGGVLRINSRNGRGTSLRVSFPVAEDGAVRPARKGANADSRRRGKVRR